MKALLINLLVGVSILPFGLNNYQLHDKVENSQFTYEVTDAKENKVYGEPIASQVTDENAGIFLYQDEIKFNVKKGEKIQVTFGQAEDDIKKVERVAINEK
ncbi:hypothetical protein RVS70_05465 [Virgibacillus sp. M23]|uniref:hypothetical protein n=1 Tax=Virgibacillus sp. M23 TaxID=3079030 RepID=UPI002A90890C|nr:hypothetical protein [Virgibacillus sp. M23]MDY7043650.1 hypothetical protein [Virgibacillus sp. M23]